MATHEPTRSTFTSMSAAHVTQTMLAINAIKDFILSSGLQPDDPLPTETQMCDDFGVSRSSIREAVRTLIALDIVEVRHGHGTFVGQVTSRPMIESLVFRTLVTPGQDHQSLRDVIEVRHTLDASLAEPLVEAWKGRKYLPIDQLLTQMEQLAGDGQDFSEEDRAFHSMLLTPLPNHLYSYLVDALWAVYAQTVPMLAAPSPTDALACARSHRTMLQAARDGDAEAYRRALDEHYLPMLAALDTP